MNAATPSSVREVSNTPQCGLVYGVLLHELENIQLVVQVILPKCACSTGKIMLLYMQRLTTVTHK